MINNLLLKELEIKPTIDSLILHLLFFLLHNNH